jgi:hypothetical protein
MALTIETSLLNILKFIATMLKVDPVPQFSRWKHSPMKQQRKTEYMMGIFIKIFL